MLSHVFGLALLCLPDIFSRPCLLLLLRGYFLNRSSTAPSMTGYHHHRSKTTAQLMNDDLLATAGDGSEIRIWNLKKKKCEHTITTERSGYLGMHFIEQTQKLVTGGFNGSLRVWDMNISKWANLEKVSVRDLKEAMQAKNVDYSDCIEKSELLERAQAHNALAPTRWRMSLEGHTGAILGLDSTGDILASSGHDGAIRFWNSTTGKLVTQLSGHEGSTNALKFFDNGTRLASVGHDGIVAVHDICEQKRLLSLGGHIGWIWGMYIDERYPNSIVSSSIDRTIRVWDASAKKCIETISDHPAEVPSVHVDWDRHRMISTSFSGKALLHDTRMWKPLIVFEGFKDRCTRIAYSPDAVYVGSIDGTVRGFNFAFGLKDN